MTYLPVPYAFAARASQIPLAYLDADLNYVSSKVINVRDFGAVGDGVVDDTAALQAAAAYLQALGGGTLRFGEKAIYRIWGVQTASLMSLTGLQGVKLEGNGCQIYSAQVNNAVGASLFLFDGCNGVSVDGFKYTGSNNALLSTTGERFIMLQGGCHAVRITNCRVYNALCGVQSLYSVVDQPCVGVTIEDLYCEQTYYGVIPCGMDHLWAKFQTVNAGRSYFPTAPCSSHTVYVDSAQGGAFSDCLLKVYSYSTRTIKENTLSDITVNYRTAGRYSGLQSSLEGMVSLEWQQGDAISSSGHMRNIRIRYDVDLTGVAAGNRPSNMFVMRRFNFAAAADNVVRNHTLRGLEVNGAGAALTNLTEWGFDICSVMGGAAAWTGDIVNTLTFRDLNLAGAPASGTCQINGQAFVVGTQSATFRNVTGDGNLVFVNLGASNVELQATKFLNIDATSNKYTSYNSLWTSSGVLPAIVNGAITATFLKSGNEVDVTVKLAPGAGTTLGTGEYSLSLPYPILNDGIGAIGSAFGFDNGVGYYAGIVLGQPGAAAMQALLVNGANFWGATVPWVMGVGDYVVLKLRYKTP